MKQQQLNQLYQYFISLENLYKEKVGTSFNTK